MGGVGGPCDFSVSPSPFGLDFGTLDYGTSDLGLTIKCPRIVYTKNVISPSAIVRTKKDD